MGTKPTKVGPAAAAMAEVVKHAMVDAGIKSAIELTDAMGGAVERRTVARMLRGERGTPPDECILIARALGLSYAELARRVEDILDSAEDAS